MFVGVKSKFKTKRNGILKYTVRMRVEQLEKKKRC